MNFKKIETRTLARISHHASGPLASFVFEECLYTGKYYIHCNACDSFDRISTIRGVSFLSFCKMESYNFNRKITR